MTPKALSRELEFMECDSCRAKPGSPQLCTGCLNNREVIEKLKPEINPFTNKNIHFHGVHPCYNNPCSWY